MDYTTNEYDAASGIEKRENVEQIEENTKENEIVSTGSSWWSSIVSTIKKQSESMASDLQKDFNEIVEGAKLDLQDAKQSITSITANIPSTLQESLKKVDIQQISSQITESVKNVDINQISAQFQESIKQVDINKLSKKAEGLSSNIFRQVNEFGKEFVSAFAEEENRNQKNSESEEALLFAFRSNHDTYTTDPDTSDPLISEKWKAFSEGFILDDHQSRIRELFYHTPGIKEICLKLGIFLFCGGFDRTVPEKTTEEMFWKRYFFKEAEFMRAQEQRKRLLNAVGTTEDTEDVSWSDNEAEEDSNNNNEKKDTEIVSESKEIPETKPVTEETEQTVIPEQKEKSPTESLPKTEKCDDWEEWE